jgi:hypothetical protein
MAFYAIKKNIAFLNGEVIAYEHSGTGDKEGRYPAPKRFRIQ